jgi:gliding motility-associated-like protein
LDVDENGCTGTRQGINSVQVDAPLAQAVVSCQSTTTSVMFSWADVPGATDYTVNLVSGAGGTYDAATRSYTVTGLSPGDKVTIEVVANGSTVCGPSRVIVECEASLCPPDVVSIDAVGPFCKDGNAAPVQLTASMSSGNTAGSFTFSGPGTTPSGIFDANLPSVNLGTLQVRATYTVDNCTYSGVRDIVINPQPSSDFTVDPRICISETSTIRYTGNASGSAVYDWNFNGGVVRSGSGQGPYEVQWSSGGDQTVGLMVTERNCPSVLESKTVTVDLPLPQPNITCTTDQTHIDFAWDPILGATNYQVNVLSGMTGAQTGNTYSISGLSPNDRVTIEVIATGTTVCGPSRDTLECIAQKCPDLTIIIPPVAPICLYPSTNQNIIDLDTTLFVTGSGRDSIPNATRTWHDGNGGNSYITLAGKFYPYAAGGGIAGTYRVCVDWEEPAGTGCVKTSCIDITTLEVPRVTLTNDSKVCVNDRAFATANSSLPGSTFTWDFGDGQVVSGTGAGPYQLSWNRAPLTDTLKVTATKDGCVSKEDVRLINVYKPLDPPIIDCDPSNTSIDFTWAPVPGATNYQTTVITPGFTPASQTTLNMFFDNLVPQTMIEIELSVRDSLSPCPPTVIRHTCTAKICPPTTLEIQPVLDTCLVPGTPESIQLSAQILNDPGNGSGTKTWSGVNVSPTGLFTPSASGNFQVLFTYFYDGCTYTASRIINMFEIPTATFQVESPICISNTSTINFTGRAPSNATYTWNFDNGTIRSGAYQGPYEIGWAAGGNKNISLVVSANGCTSTQEGLPVQVDLPLPKPVIRCDDDAKSLTSLGFIWDPVAGATSYQVFIDGVSVGTQPGTSYRIDNIANPSGTTITRNIRVVARGNTVCGTSEATALCGTKSCPFFTINIDPVDEICLNNAPASIFLLWEVLAVGGATGGGIGTWSGPGTTPFGNFDPKAAGPGTHTLTLNYEEDGCFGSATTEIIVHPAPVADAGLDTYFDCFNGIAQIGGPKTTADKYYKWERAGQVVGSNRTMGVDVAGTYTLTVTDLFSGCTASDSVVVENRKTDPNLDASVRNISCFGRRDGLISIQGVTNGNAPYLYSFNGSAFAQQTNFTNLGAGTYEIIAEDASGCRDSLTFIITEPDELTVELIIKVGTNPVLLGDSMQLEAVVNYAPELLTNIDWSPVDQFPPCDEVNISNCLTRWVTPTGQTVYRVRVEAGVGCADQDDINVVVKKIRPVYIPSGFSPNDKDGTNDFFQIFADPKVATKVKSFLIFDRWGELVFENYNFTPSLSVEPTNGWDGTFREKPFNSGVFVYFAEIEFFDGVVEIYKGDVTIK